MALNYPLNEKLKKQKVIDLLFTEGKTVTKYPLRLVYVALEESEEPLQIGVSVSKRYFKKAVDRNYFKRVLRECYRHHKHILLEQSDKPYAMMFFYQTKERLTYQEIFEKTEILFQKFIDTLSVPSEKTK
ncbi:ribonuclease P protein component [Myroides ceti]|uniref:Ribonuclease P protein component n=1 Tax=Paenimyroides ceti TaxID=395087 RepID=A0ABT8CZL5_9FLAO|nr:ribonuclease P protein component [Paenimyroides ceti]MDN3708640.1 ribonuclease P protein component [Paenimyroides ceti]